MAVYGDYDVDGITSACLLTEFLTARGGRVILRRLPEIIYTAELLDANGSWEYGLTEDEVREAFSLITTEWSAGDS